ncbi:MULTISPECIES: PQQ-binding-like beta-propeller repeat protein [unclassified Cellulophaga]|uniref:PQQ-binding-like beta-propeller repeat protein n=1 Tax=unclassified Cellulophaga TaxID=2634405 RepID=UPI000C2BD5AE|nr:MULTISPECIES: PQQ-binding-like beta-propeller repeat protein [unclassified Cellulophaga]MDO6492399.1 PQQ-binding-like beta-propeller repeat protein [Cellulophaga sp. 2_MG-2023]MDO6496101.1 PQQ-binding-like beta-propeller repeat protein [Cellulophaga sp. 3_MG-2023]PKB44943.1 outer membrane protein assembly factor BamB [Cellulophaga sp. RHA19]
MKNQLIYILAFMLMLGSVYAQNFITEGNGIRNAIVANVNKDQILYVSELDGAVAAYTLSGKKLWSQPTKNPAVLFKIVAADITNNGKDELIAASANGSIYCYNSTGKVLWTFTPKDKVRFSEVAVVNNGKPQIFAGGNNYKLYELNAKGSLVSTTKIDGVVRKLMSGNFIEKDKQSLFVMTYVHDKFRWDFFGFLNPDTKEVVRRLDYKNKKHKLLSKSMLTDFVVADINNDALDDLLIFGDTSFKPFFTALDANFNQLIEYSSGGKKGTQRYAHSKGAYLTKNKQIMFQHGSIIYVLDTKGKVVATAGEKYKGKVYSDITYIPSKNNLFAAGEVDGGNAVYTFNVAKNNWWNTTQKKQGRMLEVEENLAKLYQQTLNFKLPAYQQKSDKDWVMITSKKIDDEVANLNGNNVTFVIQRSPKESTERSGMVKIIGKEALKKDKRGKYQDSREDIVQMARDFEAKGQPFTFWAGHGNDPFYIQIETLEKILEVAPTTCYGFVYAEMANVEDPRVQYFVREYMPRLAKAIRKNNRAKLYFRYKNMFWAATSHLPLWKEMFFSKKYNDILVPASEDTSNRTQDLNLAGRVGMQSSGYVNDFAMRLIDDNPTSWRPLSPGGQRSISPYLRQGTLMAAYGARYGVVANNPFTEEPGLNILFALMKSGVLPVVAPKDMQSISAWHLIQNVDEKLIHTVDTHHDLKQYSTTDDAAVFSYAQMHWAGVNIPEHDFSNAALGVKYRWLNYMPVLPNGMVPVAPLEAKTLIEKQGKPYFVSTAKVGIKNGAKVPAKEFGAVIKAKVAEGAKQLPIVVSGASWSAIQLDENHTRLILIDPNYINPQNTKVTVTFTHKTPKQIVDILSKEELTATNNKIEITVPAGAMRFIDVAY